MATINVACGGVDYALDSEVLKELEYILKFGPIFENTMRPEGAKEALTRQGFITSIIVEHCREKIAATPLGYKIYNKMLNQSIETDLNLDLEKLTGTSTTGDFLLEAQMEATRHGLNQGIQT